MQVHFPPKQVAFGDPAHWSLKAQDWFKARVSIQTTNNCISIQKYFDKLYNFSIYMVLSTVFLHPWYGECYGPWSHPLYHHPLFYPLAHPLLHFSEYLCTFYFGLPLILFSFSVHMWSLNYDVMFWIFQYKWHHNSFERRKFTVWR